MAIAQSVGHLIGTIYEHNNPRPSVRKIQSIPDFTIIIARLSTATVACARQSRQAVPSAPHTGGQCRVSLVENDHEIRIRQGRPDSDCVFHFVFSSLDLLRLPYKSILAIPRSAAYIHSAFPYIQFDPIQAYAYNTVSL